nr:sugar ABC transporter permease [Listeria innocua]
MSATQLEPKLMTRKAPTFGEKVKTFMNRDNVAGYIFSAPFIIGFLLITFIPMCLSFYYSFTDYRLVNTPSLVGLKNYLRLLTDLRFLNSVKVTAIYVAVSVPLKLAFALFVAYLLTRKIRGVTLYRSLYYVPSLIGGSIAVALVWKELFSRNGLINILLNSIGLPSLSWFGDQQIAMIPLILMSVWQFGSSMIIFAAGLKEIPNSFYEAAEMDGANKWQAFYKITIPQLSPVILYNLVMQTITAFMVFTQAFVITKGGPSDATNFYALYVYNQAFKYYDMGYASAMSWVMLVVMSIVTVLIFKTSKKWVSYDQ